MSSTLSESIGTLSGVVKRFITPDILFWVVVTAITIVVMWLVFQQMTPEVVEALRECADPVCEVRG